MSFHMQLKFILACLYMKQDLYIRRLAQLERDLYRINCQANVATSNKYAMIDLSVIYHKITWRPRL
jgi:hypothetical protein